MTKGQGLSAFDDATGGPVWVVTVAPGSPLEKLKADLSRAGLTVDQVLDAIWNRDRPWKRGAG
jgi:hypothetical protein